LVISLLVIFIARLMKNGNPASVLRNCLLIAPVLVTIVSAIAMPILGLSQSVTIALAAGAFGGGIIGLVTDFYTAASAIRKIAEACTTGAGTGVIRGLAVGMESLVIPMAVVALAGGIANAYLGLYGIAIAAVGMLAGTAVVMSVDAYGP